MTKILGLDLGTNSIGWAIINKESEKIIDMGVRIFKAGVENLGQGEKEISKNASRTAARGTRRQYFRRKIRRKHILKILKENKMCPIDETQFQAWIKLNPYELRYRATFEKIGLIELGRIFFHLSKRRGFLSNSRSALANSDGTIFKGGNGKIGISATSENLNNGTLGNYLYNILPKENTPHKGGLPRVRNRYTTRQMYIEEFEQIWNTQAKFHNILTDELKDKIGGRKKDGYKNDGILFYQRPLRSQKHKVGKCTFEPTKTKSPISAIPYELFRAWQFINNIECNGEKLSESEKQMVLEVIKSKDKKFNFSVIRKKLKLADADYKFNYQNDDKVTGCPTIAKLSHKKCFGKEWDQLSNEEKDKIWHVIYFFDDKEKLKQYAKSKWGFDDTKAEYVSKIYFKPDYGSLSRKAIDNILEFLEMGFQYDIAVALGGVKNVFGKDRWSGLSVSDKNFILDNVPNIVRSNLTGGYAKALKKALQSQFQFSEKELRKLYHHSTNINDTKTVLKKLPTGAEADRQIGKIRNPIVIQALFELRKVVNALIDEYGSFDQINIELARDLKIPKTARQKIRLDNKSREKYHDDIKVELAKINQYPTHTNILKYKLWEECQHQCPYTGNEISLTQLYNGEVEIEHIIPYSRSLDDSYLNKTLCFTEENAAKGKQTPHEYYTSLGTWESVKSRALKLFYDSKKFPNRYKKYKRFITSRLDDNFISRQLNDTRYISKEAKAYLSMICDKVRVAPGQMTAKLRYFWGLNNIIGDENDAKSREDHRHHAIDALVMACHEASYLNEMSRWNRYNRSYDLREFPHPWDGFRYQAIEKVKRILVSHKQNNRVLTSRKYTVKKNGSKSTSTGIAARGQLTKDTVYGKRQSPYSGEHAYHIRKPIESLKNHKHVNSIVDKNVKKIILEFLKANGIDTASKFDIPSGLFLEVDKETGLTTPKVFMPNKNGNPVPIRNIRRKAAIGNAIQLKEAVNQWVDPRNNHHILIYVDKNGEQKESVVQFL
ncbi:MAG: type II CRISPR RNA-guided endonuclease Cas9, partial [Bacteroidota bacterium]